MAVVLRNADSGGGTGTGGAEASRGLSGSVPAHLLASKPDPKDTVSAGSGLVSLVLHALGIMLFVWLTWVAPQASEEAAGGAGGGLFAGGGGGGGSGGEEQITYLTVPPASAAAETQAETVIPDPVPVTVPPPPIAEVKVEIPRIVAPAVVPTGLVRTADNGVGTGSGGGAGTGTGTGSGGGTGSGSGGGDGSGIGTGTGPGTGGRAWPPSPRALMLPPQAPSSLRGKSVTVRLAVDSAGVVQNVELAPGSGNGDFDKKLRETARQWLFRPARDAAGRAVAALFEVVFSF